MYLKTKKKLVCFSKRSRIFVLAKDPLFSLLSDAPQELAQIEIGKGEPGIRGGAGGTKKRMAYLQQTRTFILTYYPKVYLKSKNAGYFHFSAAPQQKSSGQQSASRCLPYYNSAPGCSASLHLNYSSLSSGISSSKASIQLSLCHLSFSPFSLAAPFCRCAWSFIMVPIGFSARSSIMW